MGSSGVGTALCDTVCGGGGEETGDSEGVNRIEGWTSSGHGRGGGREGGGKGWTEGGREGGTEGRREGLEKGREVPLSRAPTMASTTKGDKSNANT